MLQSILELGLQSFSEFFFFNSLSYLPCKPVVLCFWELCTEDLELYLGIFCYVF